MPEFEAILGSELASAARSLGLSIAAVVSLSGDGFPGYTPSSYRIDTADGRTVKGRRFATTADAELAEGVARALPPHTVPAPLARCGVGMITEWAAGSRLEASRCSDTLLRRCAALLARAHVQPFVENSPDLSDRRLRRQSAILAERLAVLVEIGALPATDAQQVAAMAERYRPPAAELGLILGDFCPENTIVSDSARVCFIDHETLAIEHCDYDLARTWYRWPMNPAQRNEFFSAYAEHRSLASLHAHFPFWTATALVGSAWFRGLRHVEAAAVPVAKLRGLVAALLAEGRPENLLYAS